MGTCATGGKQLPRLYSGNHPSLPGLETAGSRNCVLRRGRCLPDRGWQTISTAAAPNSATAFGEIAFRTMSWICETWRPQCGESTREVEARREFPGPFQLRAPLFHQWSASANAARATQCVSRRSHLIQTGLPPTTPGTPIPASVAAPSDFCGA